MFSFQHQGPDLRNADVGVVGLGIDGEQRDAVIESGIVDHAETATLAAPSRPIGQAHFVDGVSDFGYSLAGALILFKLVNQASDRINCLGKLTLKPIKLPVK